MGKLLKSPRFIVLIFIILLVSTSLKLNQLGVLLSTDDLITPDFETYPALQEIKTEFKRKDYGLLIIENPKGQTNAWDMQTLCRLRLWANTESLSNPNIEHTFSPLNLRVPEQNGNKLFYPNLIKMDCDTFLPNQLSIPYSPWEKNLYSKDQKDLTFHFFINPDTVTKTTLFTMGEGLVKQADLLMTSFTNFFKTDIKAHWLGSIVYQYYLKEGYDQTGSLNIIVVIFIVLVFRYFYGTFLSSIIFLATLIITTWLVYNLMSICGFPVDVLSNSIFLMLALATIEDFIFLTSHQLELVKSKSHLSDSQAWRKSFKDLMVPCGLTSLTTIIGFGSLAISDLAIIKRFGIITAFGSLMEWIIIFIVLPNFISLFPKFQIWVAPEKVKNSINLDKFLKWKPRRILSYLLLIIIPLGLYFGQSLHVDDNPNELFPASHPFNQGVNYIRKSRGQDTVIDLIFKSDVTTQDKKIILDKIKQTGPLIADIDDYQSKIDFLTKDANELRADLIKSDFKSTVVYQSYISNSGKEKVMVYLTDSSIKSLNKAIDDIKNVCGDKCFAAGTLVSYAEFGSKVPKTLLESLSISIILVTCILLIIARIRKIKQIIPIIISAVWGPSAILFILYAINLKIYFATSVFASILVGLAGDNAIQYMFAKNQNENQLITAVQNKSGPSFIFGLCLIFIPSVFIISYFRPIQILGWIFGLGAAALIFGDFWLLKGLLSKKNDNS